MLGHPRPAQAFWQVKDVEAEVAEPKSARSEVRGVRHAWPNDEKQHYDGRRGKNRLVQGHRGEHSRDRPTDNPRRSLCPRRAPHTALLVWFLTFLFRRSELIHFLRQATLPLTVAEHVIPTCVWPIGIFVLSGSTARIPYHNASSDIFLHAEPDGEKARNPRAHKSRESN